MAKIGRNHACPCGSGKKYKRCHGANAVPRNSSGNLGDAIVRMEAKQIQRVRQQGLGKPIISAEAFGRRFVAVNNRLLHSKTWRTFHDFLGAYIRTVIGSEWGNAELLKPLAERHPILVWYHHVCNHQRQFVTVPGQVHSAPATGAVSAYLQLAYDLYALEHNAGLQRKLIERLRNRENFYGARYEVFVAAMLIRAGFDLEFEDEDDRASSHCEFTATFPKTGKRFSVEAKQRSGTRFRLGRQLHRALAKTANHPRIVFIEIGPFGDAESSGGSDGLLRALEHLRAFEGRPINGRPLPNAFLFVTSTPWHHDLQGPAGRVSVLAEGFQIPDFKGDASFISIRAALEARERHLEMHALLGSIRDHGEIPSTFDGEIPEFAFGDGSPRLMIGQRYLVKDDNGVEQPGLLTTATVMESEGVAYCGLSFEGGKSAIFKWPLSEGELAAWRRHPDTFFGNVQQRTTKAEHPLELYDFFHSCYQHTTRDKLLAFMSGARDLAQLQELDQPALASIYAERCAYRVLARRPQSLAENGMDQTKARTSDVASTEA
jgi:hypothetical protein